MGSLGSQPQEMTETAQALGAGGGAPSGLCRLTLMACPRSSSENLVGIAWDPSHFLAVGAGEAAPPGRYRMAEAGQGTCPLKEHRMVFLEEEGMDAGFSNQNVSATPHSR